MLVASAVCFVFLTLTLIVARAHQVPSLLWLRDVAAYVLFAAAPLLAFDARRAGTRFIVASLTLAGLLGAASFSLEWMDRRSLSAFPVTHLLLPSGAIAAALFAYATSRILTRPSLEPPWLPVLGFIAGAMWITGTRSALVILAAPAAITVFGPRTRLLARLRRALLAGPTVGVLALLFAIGISALAHVDLARSAGRMISIANPLATQVDPSAGPTTPPVAEFRASASPSQSAAPESVAAVNVGPLATLPSAVAAQTFNERAIQTALAWQIFVANPIFGTGPGHVYIWKGESGLPLSSFSLDTPLALPAKFGIVGTGALFVLLLALAAHIRRAGTSAQWAASEAALLGYASIWIANLPLGFPFEDKGFSLGLLLLIVLTLQPQLGSRPPEPAD
jgi:hypothetical protein